MDFVDFVLNLAGLLLWLNWRAERLDSAYRAPVISLAHAVRKASSSPLQRWRALVFLLGLLVLRGVVYWQIGRTQPHTFKLDLVAIELPFLSNHQHFWLIQLYSLLSFLFTLAYFYLALLLCSLVNGNSADKEAAHRFVRIHLGRLDQLPSGAKWLVPCGLGAGFWMLACYGFASLGIVPRPDSFAELWQQGLVIGLGVYLNWQWVILIILVLHMVNSYVYLGRLTFWEYVQVTGRNLLAPLSSLPLRVGKVDFAPVLAMALVSAGALLLRSGWAVPKDWNWVPTVVTRGVLPWLYQHVPF